ncbi:Protein unc-93 -like protein A [Triplophysa tibetana]|uniref:Protein unc-93 homolog A n=1 Tax=Triplophysa tibetana TaxID=1572043 RepID=A0A5A9NFU8_9TELE|nr:Protein unc-93 -like protein A [Triplophysa tibetana]
MQFFVVHAGVGLLAIIFVAVFLDNIDRDLAREFRQNKGNKSFCSTFLATFTLLKDPKLLMLIPLTMYSGFEQSFLASEYTKNYVTCALGIHYVGFVMICFGAANSLCSFAFGRLAAYTGRIALFCLALYGILFAEHKEAAFANYRMWESLGFVIAFAYSTYICLSTKIYIVLAVLALTMVTYLYVEYNEYKLPTAQVSYDMYNPEKADVKDMNEKYVNQTEL